MKTKKLIKNLRSTVEYKFSQYVCLGAGEGAKRKKLMVH